MAADLPKAATNAGSTNLSISTSARPRRSVLYMPGANTRALEKGRNLPADALILDLEDAVSPDSKAVARQNIVNALAQGGYGQREIIVRCNGLDTPWGHDDIAAIAKSSAENGNAHALLLPKVESANQIHQAETILANNGASPDLTIWCMMETPLGILRAEEIAQASNRVKAFVMGTSDLAKDLNCLHTPMRLPMVHSLSVCILVARAYGLTVLDGVHLNLDDEAGFEASCTQGLEMGFDGKTLIHPKTIAVANTVFAPSASELAWAERIIEAYAAAEAEGKGVVLVDGKLVEALHIEAAKRSLALNNAIETLAKQ